MPVACQVRSAPSCFDHLSGYVTLSKPFLSPGGLQNSRHQAFKAAVISQVNTAGVRDELDSKDPDATSFLINPDETLWEQEIIIRKTLLWGTCLPAFLNLQAVCKTVSKVCKTSFFYSILLLAWDFPKPELLNFNTVSQPIHGLLKLTCVLVLHASASPFFLG